MPSLSIYFLSIWFHCFKLRSDCPVRLWSDCFAGAGSDVDWDLGCLWRTHMLPHSAIPGTLPVFKIKLLATLFNLVLLLDMFSIEIVTLKKHPPWDQHVALIFLQSTFNVKQSSVLFLGILIRPKTFEVTSYTTSFNAMVIWIRFRFYFDHVPSN